MTTYKRTYIVTPMRNKEQPSNSKFYFTFRKPREWTGMDYILELFKMNKLFKAGVHELEVKKLIKIYSSES